VRRGYESVTGAPPGPFVTVGFLHFGRSQVVPYAELRTFTVSEKELLSNGTRQGLRRSVSLRTSEARLGFTQLALDGQPDPLLDFLRTASDAVAVQVKARVASGLPLSGRRWQLDGRGLTVGRAEPVPIDEISEVEVYDARLRAWRGSDERPFLSVPADSPNTLVLQKVLRARLAEGTPRPGPGGLGRVLFARRLGPLGLAVLCLLALGGGLVGFVVRAGGEAVVGIVLLGCAALLAVGAAAQSRAATRFRELGIEKRSLLGAELLPWPDPAGTPRVRGDGTRRDQPRSRRPSARRDRMTAGRLRQLNTP
jgi:hypothetical protein